MEEQTLRKTRWFWPWQDQEQERWLREMSLAGWHLVSLGFATYTFTRGEPLDYVYRLDCRAESKRAQEEYLQFFRDAGWEYLGKQGSWHCFRQLRGAGDLPEIYTDAESKLQKYRRLFFSLLTPSPLSMVVFLAAMKKYPGRHPQWFVIMYVSIFVVWTLYAVVAAVKVLMRMNELKQIKPI